jgi:signal transduction histidine kinase
MFCTGALRYSRGMSEDSGVIPAREMLRQTEALFGGGNIGDTPMARLAEQTIERARDTQDHESEALAYFYNLYPAVFLTDETVMLGRLAEARRRCEFLGVQRGVWLLEDLKAYVAAVKGRHQEAIAIGQRLDRLSESMRPPFERSISLLLLTRYCAWVGRLDDALRMCHRAVKLAEQSGHPTWLAATCVGLGGLLTRDALNPEDGLPHAERGRAILAGQPLSLTTVIATAQVVAALDLMGEHDRAYAVFKEDLARPGVRELLTPRRDALIEGARSRLTAALIGVGRLDEAEAWLDEFTPEAYGPLNYRYAVAPVMRLRLLCRQHRYEEARALALIQRDHPVTHSRTPHDMVTIFDHLREACDALGDEAGAAEAVAAAREACLPLVALSARARYLSTQLQLDPTRATPLSAIDLRRLAAIEDEARAQSNRAVAKPQVPRFLAHVVHELRNPIGGMVGMSSLLLMSNLDDKQRRYTSAMQQSADTLLQLVNDVLDLAKIESGQFSIGAEPIALGPWLQQCTEGFVAIAQKKGLDLHVDLDPSLPQEVVGDPLRLRQVLTNLLSNALKFTRTGRIDVRLTRGGPVPAGKVRLRAEVQDTGKGISEQALGHLFEEFVQADATIARDYGGTGLGLALCKQLVERMGGRIGARSQFGVGSTFWFELTLDVASA